MNQKELLEFITSKNKEYSEKTIEFKSYCLKRMEQRNIEKKTVLKVIFEDKELIYVEPQEKSYKGEKEQRYKLVYALSGKYKLIIIVSYCERVLNVINVIKTSKDWERLWRKKIFY
jgi:hypothetical protein